MVAADSWLKKVGSTLWGRRSPAKPSPPIAVLAFEVASLMSKLAHLWRSLDDEQVVRLRDHVLRHPGVRKLVSDDEDYLLKLAVDEILDALALLTAAVARLGRRCADPVLHGLDHLFDELARSRDPLKWLFTPSKMKEKMKKMDKLIGATANLYLEMEALVHFEQNLRRMRANGVDPNSSEFVEYQKKVAWQRQEVKYLKENSLWNRSFDYGVRLLARSIFTIYARIQYVFGIHLPFAAGSAAGESRAMDHLPRSRSITSLGAQSTVHPSESSGAGMFASGPLGMYRNAASRFASGPLTQSGPLFGTGWLSKAKKPAPKASAFSAFLGGGAAEYDLGYLKSGALAAGAVGDNNTTSFFNSKGRLLANAPPSTLGASALALHYANVVIVIEKMVTYPHAIAPDAKDDLYNMLPTAIRAALRSRLKYCSKNIGTVDYDVALAAEWSDALSRILDWLAPLAHNMIRWQSERSYEQQHSVAKTNVLLLQTLYFADQAKTEGAITELLVGLNYICRFHRDNSAKACALAAGNLDLE